MSDNSELSSSSASPSPVSLRKTAWNPNEIRSHTRSQLYELAFKWTIDDFSHYFLNGASGKVAKSSTFSSAVNAHKHKFFLELNIDCQQNITYGRYGGSASVISNLEIVLNRNRMIDAESAESKISFFNSAGKKCGSRESRWKFVKGQSCSCVGVLPSAELDILRRELFPTDQLVLQLELKVITNRVTESISNPNLAETASIAMKSTFDDYGTLLSEGKFADVTFRVGREGGPSGTFKVHRIILAARSPVFAAMFEHDMLESRQNRVDITDLEPLVFEHMLKYIYTGDTTSINKFDHLLLEAADKYQIDSLKQICEQSLCSKIKPETLSFLLRLAELHNSDNIKSLIIDYIKHNGLDLFDIISREQPEIVAQVFEDYTTLVRGNRNPFGWKSWCWIGVASTLSVLLLSLKKGWIPTDQLKLLGSSVESHSSPIHTSALDLTYVEELRRVVQKVLSGGLVVLNHQI